MSKCLLLVMAKDEEPTILRALNSARPHVQAVCYVDTGSTDKTEARVREWMQWTGVPGRVHSIPWQGFGESRTRAFWFARAMAEAEKCDWVFFLDADDELEAEPGFRWPKPGLDGYRIDVKRPDAQRPMQHAQVLLFRADAMWHWVGRTHELPECEGATIGPVLPGVHMVYHQDSRRHRDGTRTPEDILLLERQIAEQPDDPRWVYYLARTHREAGNLEQALELYEKRSGMGGFDQETYAALLGRAVCLELLRRPMGDVLFAYFAAHQVRPSRRESLAHASRYVRMQGWPELAGALDCSWQTLPKTSDVLDVDRSLYPAAPERIAIGIITYPRKPSPLPNTYFACIAADSLVEADLIHVFADCVNPCLPPVIACTPRTQEELDTFDSGDCGCRFMAVDNMARALEWGASTADIVVELEDDVLFSRRWLTKARQLLSAAEAASHGRPVCLSAHDMFVGDKWDEFNWPIGVNIEGYRLFEPRPGMATNGAQCHVMRASTAVVLAKRLRSMVAGLNAESRKWLPPDRAMIRACRESGTRFVITDPSLVWHQQNESTWFAKDYPRSVAQTRSFVPW